MLFHSSTESLLRFYFKTRNAFMNVFKKILPKLSFWLKTLTVVNYMTNKMIKKQQPPLSFAH